MAKNELTSAMLRALRTMHTEDQISGRSCYTLSTASTTLSTMKALQARGLVEPNHGQWRLTDAGRAALEGS